MFKLNEIRELIRLLDETSVAELLVENDGTKLHIKKPATTISQAPVYAPQSVQMVQPITAPASHVQGAPEPSTATNVSNQVITEKTEPSTDNNVKQIVSPMVGTFYNSPAPDKPPYVSVGSKVEEKTVVCIVEAMKFMNEIEADLRGEITSILVENGQMVDYGQPLFLVKVER